MPIPSSLALVCGLLGFALLVFACSLGPTPGFARPPARNPARRALLDRARGWVGCVGLALLVVCALSVSPRTALMRLLAGSAVLVAGIAALAVPTEKARTGKSRLQWLASTNVAPSSLSDEQIDARREPWTLRRDVWCARALLALAIACAVVWPPLAIIRIGPALADAFGPWAQITGAFGVHGAGDAVTELALRFIYAWGLDCALIFACRTRLKELYKALASHRNLDLRFSARSWANSADEMDEAAFLAKLKALAAAGADPLALRTQGGGGLTPLMHAARMGWSESVHWLLGIVPEAARDEDDTGWTALMHAVDCGQLDCADALAPFSDPLRASNETAGEHAGGPGATALTLAVFNDQAELTKRLLARFGALYAAAAAKARGPARRRANPLFLAAERAKHNEQEMVAALAPWFNAKAQDGRGHTPLMVAALAGNAAMVRALLPISDPSQATRKGETALDLLLAQRLKAQGDSSPGATEDALNSFHCADILAPVSPREAAKKMFALGGRERMPATSAFLERDELMAVIATATASAASAPAAANPTRAARAAQTVDVALAEPATQTASTASAESGSSTPPAGTPARSGRARRL